MAKKNQSRYQRLTQKRQKRRKSPPRDAARQLAQRVRQQGFVQDVIQNPPGQVKMSEVLRQFIDPYWYIPDDEESMQKLMVTALVAWNTALLPQVERVDHLAQIAEALPQETHADFYAIVEEMIERKEKYFAQYERTIIDYELVDRGGDYQLSVISFLPDEEK